MDTSTVMTNYPRQRTVRRVTKITRPPRLPSTTTNAARSTSPTRSARPSPQAASIHHRQRATAAITEPSPSQPTSAPHKLHAQPGPPLTSHRAGVSTSCTERRVAITGQRPLANDKGCAATNNKGTTASTKGARQLYRSRETTKWRGNNRGIIFIGKQTIAPQFKGWPVLLSQPLRP